MAKDPLKCKWEEYKTKTEVIVMTCDGCKPRAVIASFDMDGTIITTKSGNTFSKNVDDWKLWAPEVKTTLQKLHHEDGYKIVFFTNQGGIETGKVKKEDFRRKITAIVKELDVPIQLFAATSKNCLFRKPRPGSFELLEKYYNGGIAIDLKDSFYCGDAAGRKRQKKSDFSCSDRLFAMNTGLKFYVPEKLFLKQKNEEHFELPKFNPRDLLENPPKLLEGGSSLTSSAQEVILMVGAQGSGKSFFCENHLAKAGYAVVSNDKTGSRDKSITLMTKMLQEGRSVVVDNTHVDVNARQKFVDIAKKFNVPCRCFVMNTSKEQVQHNLVFRLLTDDQHTKIFEPLMLSYFKNFQPPTKNEGFNEITKVNIVPQFEYKQHQSLYYMYLVEK